MLTVVFSEMEMIGGFTGEGTGSVGLTVEDASGVFVVLPGDGLAGSLIFNASAAIPGIDAGAQVQMFFNNTGEVVTVSGPFGTIELPAFGPNSAEIWIEADIEFNFPGIEISGTFSFASGSSTLVVGTQVNAFVGDNISSNRIGVELNDGRAFFYDNGVMSGYVTGDVSFVGIDGLTVSSRMTLRYNAATSVVSESAIVAGDTIELEFSADEVGDGTTPFIQFVAEDVAIDLGGVMALGGDLTLTRAPGTFNVLATDAYTFIGDGPYLRSDGSVNAEAVGVAISNVDLAMFIDTDSEGGDYSVYASGDAVLLGVDSVTLGGSLNAWANTTGTQTIDFGGTVGEIDYGTTSDVYAFAGNDVVFSVSDFVSISGSVSLQYGDDGVTAIGEDITASLDLSESVFARVTGANFGLTLDGDEFAFETTGGAFALGLGDFASVTVDSVTVQYTNGSTTVAAATELEVFGREYTFDNDIEADTVSFVANGFSANFLDIVTLDGNFGFASVGSELRVVAEHVDATIEAGDFSAGIRGGTLGLLYRDDKIAFEGTGSMFING